MNIRLEDVIDLEYLIHADEDPESREDALKLAERDRAIYSRSSVSGDDEKALLFSWLNSRRKQFKDPLPGHAVSTALSLTWYILIFAGSLLGVITAWSFLAYHGARPVNVALYLFLFVGMPLILSFAALLIRPGRNHSFPFFHILLSSVSFKLIPKLMGKTMGSFEYVHAFFKGSKDRYQAVFFWLFFILTSLFSFCFSAGVLGATFLKVLVSDLAFGWQSTLISDGRYVYDMVSTAAIPWKWFMTEGVAHPGLEQVLGSRIILKEGIEVLATKDLVSWWPFICMAVLTYAVIPRVVCIGVGKIILERKLTQLDFSHPRFRQLIIRMLSPVLEIDDKEEMEQAGGDTFAAIEEQEIPSMDSETVSKGFPAAILSPESVYSEAALKQVVQYVRQYMFIDTGQVHPVSFDFDLDEAIISSVIESGSEQVILLQEAWQPPIRGILYYLKQIRDKLPENISMYVLLTGDAGQKNLSIDKTDMNARIWEKAVYELNAPGILTKRML